MAKEKEVKTVEEPTDEYTPPPGNLEAAAPAVSGREFPTEFPTDDIKLLATALMTGTVTASPELGFAAYNVVGYGMGQILGQPKMGMESVPGSLPNIDTVTVPPHTLNNKTAANLLNEALRVNESAQSGNEAIMAFPPINWLKIVQFVGPILIKILSGLA